MGGGGYMDIESFTMTGGTICADAALWRDLLGKCRPGEAAGNDGGCAGVPQRQSWRI